MSRARTKRQRPTSTTPTFRVGQRIVCVDAASNPRYAGKVLTAGKIYVLRGIDQTPGWKAPGWGIYLEGIRIFHPDDGMEWAFHPRRFRPVTERPTDIEVFKRLLVDVPTEIDE